MTAPQLESLASAYRSALLTYLHAPSESLLADAYDLGRRALGQGFGVIDWAAVHDEALASVQIIERGVGALARAAVFFRESLSPFEMTQRGYAETNVWLERLNQDLRREITAKDRLAEQLREANQDLEAFSYSVAHDLQAPLRHIEGFSKALVEQLGESLADEPSRLLGRVGAAAQRMSELIKGLLALSRVGRAEMVSESVDLAARTRALAATLLEAQPARRVVFDVVEPLQATGDPRLLDAVLQNLVGNAWKFTSQKSEARIQVGVDASKAPPVYFVRDDGAGFDPAYADKLFGVFQRLHPHEEFPGTGIGLATVQRIIRRHGGRIWAEGAVERGATFYFTLAPPAGGGPPSGASPG
jgi:signal transduction histidine kinase